MLKTQFHLCELIWNRSVDVSMRAILKVSFQLRGSTELIWKAGVKLIKHQHGWTLLLNAANGLKFVIRAEMGLKHESIQTWQTNWLSTKPRIQMKWAKICKGNKSQSFVRNRETWHSHWNKNSLLAYMQLIAHYQQYWQLTNGGSYRTL